MYRKFWYLALCSFVLSISPMRNCLMIQAVSISLAQGDSCDVGPVSITNPPNIVTVDSTYTPSTIVKNFSSYTADLCSVFCTIDLWADTAEILNLLGDDSVTVDFTPWVVPDTGIYVGSYSVTVFTRCATDSNPPNDTLSKSVYIPTDTLIIVSTTGFTNQTVRIPLYLVNSYHSLGGASVGAYFTEPNLAEFDSADYSSGSISYWEWLQSETPSATTIYLDAIADQPGGDITPPLHPSSNRRLLAELIVHIDSLAPGTILPYDWSEVNNDPGIQTWMRHKTNPRTGDACASVEAESFWPNDDWLITPNLSVNSNDSLEFWYRVEDGSYPESIEVRLSPSTIDIDSFSTVLWAGSLTNTSYLEKKIDLTPYAGQNVYIAFIYKSQDKRRLYIDDVSGPALSEGFEEASGLIDFSIVSFLFDSTGYVYYLPIKVSGVLSVQEGLCGDVNGDGRITGADATYIVVYIYRGGPAPVGPADVNLDGRITGADGTYITSYIYRHGPPPCEPGGSLNLQKKGGESE